MPETSPETSTETISGYDVHPACAMLPMMSEASLHEMADDILIHGQQQPVVLFQGLLLDGRNRLRACEMAGIKPRVEEWEGEDPVRWVLSLNFHRRHLSDSQKSVVGARAEELLAHRVTEANAEAASALEEGPNHTPVLENAPTATEIRRQARETAAALVNISPNAIARGRKLIDNAVPELVGAVARGAVTLTQASRVAKLDESAQRELVAQGDDAIVEEASRIQKSQGAQRPSLARTLTDLDLLCSTLEISKSGPAQWRVKGTLHTAPEQVFVHAGATIKEALMNAWAQTQAGLEAT